MQTHAHLIPLAAVIGLLALTWYSLAMPTLIESHGMGVPSSAIVLDAR